MFSAAELLQLQREQHAHDLRNHFDIISLHKEDRLKHYGLHFAKYVGRLAREHSEEKSVDRTLVDAFLVSLSAANTLHQNLSLEADRLTLAPTDQIDPLRLLADASGRFADACEKIDHLEDFLQIAKRANLDIFKWIVSASSEREVDLRTLVNNRRKELAERHFYIQP
jgi:hypothetical protein